jgi:hypothetical protein
VPQGLVNVHEYSSSGEVSIVVNDNREYGRADMRRERIVELELFCQQKNVTGKRQNVGGAFYPYERRGRPLGVCPATKSDLSCIFSLRRYQAENAKLFLDYGCSALV